MARFNPYGNLAPVSSITDTRDFMDPLQPQFPFTLTFCVDPGQSAANRVAVTSAELAEKWVTGDAEYRSSKGARGKAPQPPTVPIGNATKTVTVSERQCQTIAWFIECGRPTGADAPPSEPEWLAMSEAFPTAYGEVYEWWSNLLLEARGLQGNEWRVSAATTLETPSPSTSDTTPTS